MAEGLRVAYPPLEHMLAGDPRLSRADLQHLQDWLAKQPHLPPMLDEELAPFLACSEYSLQRAKQLVDKFWTMRTHAPELFSGRDPDDADNREQLQAFRVARLPRCAPGGQRVVVLGYAPAAAFDPARFDGARSLRLSTALMEVVGLQEAQAPAGRAPLALLLDALHVSLAHLARTPLPALQRLMAFVQEAAPLRISAVHVIRLGAVGHRALALVRPLMSPELQRMTHFHSGDMAEFYEEFPKDILPEEFGGTCGTIAEYHGALVRELCARREWLLAQEARRVDEGRRPPGAASPLQGAYAQLFGAHGSFRQLQID
ncbi:hypothetical protein R5R35_009828 [Gryllus longicercus]|uniref:CRAL-TRIO domain-containing protein n=1 Tax=Gryllus longicercus TaxID=2509291 RepID=A0AAN9VN75_9ORTH